MNFFTLFTLATCTLLCLMHASQSDAQPDVECSAGTFRGKSLTSLSGRTFAAFRGIPYAKPPVGQLRFAKPQPFVVKGGVYDATKPAPICLQPVGTSSEGPGQEDCLYLNVFTPENTERHRGAGYKVLIFIHGGAFFKGSGNAYVPGDLVAQEEVIVVTFNYRLSWLGFVKGNSSLLPGNQGLWDQLMALKWVKDNIEAFGGDPADITLSGESMGGESVSLWSILKQGKNLFSKGIPMSGTMFSCESRPGSSDILFDLLLDRVGCWPGGQRGDQATAHFDWETTAQVVACLRSLPAERYILPFEGVLTNKFTTIDGELIPAHIPDLVKDLQYLTEVGFFSKQFLVLLVNHEGAAYDPAPSEDEESQAKFLSHKVRIPVSHAQRVLQWYKANNGYRFDVVRDIITDRLLAMPTFDLLRSHTHSPEDQNIAERPGKSHFLFFDHMPEYMGSGPDGGIYHGIELCYLFDMSPDDMLRHYYNGRTIGRGFNDEDWRLRKVFSKIVADFMHQGNPGKSLFQDPADQWSSYEEESQFYLSFKPQWKVQQFPFAAQKQFWSQEYPEWVEEINKAKGKDEL